MLFALGLIWIIAATIQDIRKREVANWLNFSLIIFALGFRFFYSLFNNFQFRFFYEGLIGLGIFFILGNLFYYGRLFAGGDAKLMIALGTILPLTESFNSNVFIFIEFLFLFLVFGAVYGLLFSLYLTFSHFDNFKKEYRKQLKRNKKLFYASILLAILLIVFSFVNSLLAYLGLLVFIFPYFYFYAKSVDEACMIKTLKPKELTEGDWLYKDVRVGKKVINSTWDGLSLKDIELIKKNRKNVLVKQGIPFVPVFLFSFLVFIYIYFKGITFIGLV